MSLSAESTGDGAAADSSTSSRSSLQLVLLAWVFGAGWMWTINGAAMTRFARLLETPDWAFGLLAAMPHAGALVQLPVSYLLDRFGRRRLIFMWTVGAGRLLWVVLGIMPWLGLPYPWLIMLFIVLASWMFMHAGTPAWFNWMADVIPRRVRGRFFAQRNRVGQMIGLVATLSIGYLLDLVELAGDHEMLRLTCTLLALAGWVGFVDIMLFLRISDPKSPHGQRQTRWIHRLREPLREPSFRVYLAYNFTLIMAMTFVGHYIWLYVFDVLGLSNAMGNTLLLAAPLIIMAATYGTWGRLVDKVGKRPVLIIAGLMTVFGTLGWLLTSPGLIWPGYAVCIIATVAWPGVEVANFNIMLGFAGKRSEGHAGAGGASYVALNNLASAAGGICSGLLAAVIAEAIGDWRWTVPVVGHVASYHSVLLLLSMVLRIVAAWLAFQLEEPTAFATRDAIRHVSGGVYSNMAQVMFWPTRVVGHVTRWTYRLGPNRKDDE